MTRGIISLHDILFGKNCPLLIWFLDLRPRRQAFMARLTKVLVALPCSTLDGSNPEILLQSISRYYRFLPSPQQQAFLAEVNLKA